MVFRRSRMRRLARPGLRRGRKLNPRQKKEVKMIISKRLEIKQHPFYGNLSVGGGTGSYFDLTAIASGDVEDSRASLALRLNSVDFRYEIVGSDEYNNVRVMLVRWSVDDKLDPFNLAEVLDMSAGGGFEHLYPYNYPHRSKYHICYDKVHTVRNSYSFSSTGGVTSATADYGNLVKVVGNVRITGKRLGNKMVRYDEDADTYGRFKLYLALVSDSTVLLHPGFSYAGRILYTDA